MTFQGGLARHLMAFKRREDGAIAVQMAFLALPLTVLAFGMVDVNRASVAKKDLQDALDAATLIAGRSMAVTQTEIQSVGSAALAGQLSGRSDAQLVSSTFTLNGSTITSTASVKLTPIVANLWLNSDMQVGAASQIFRSMNKLEVAMVLDNTGSMKGTKLSELKTATNDFIDQLSAAAARSTETNPVKIGIVPFSSVVRIGSTTTEINAYKTAAWMDAAGNNAVSKEIFYNSSTGKLGGGTAVNRFTLFNNTNTTWAGCVEGRQQPYDVQESPPTTTTPATLFTPFFSPDEPDDTLLKTYNSVNNYESDGASLTWNYDRRLGTSSKYNSSPNPSSRGPNYGCSIQSISRLSTNWAALKTKVNAMVADGETHIPLGMIWGWHVLSPNAPFADGVSYSTPKTTKIVVLMTDGDNTYVNSGANNDTRNITRYDGYGYASPLRLGASVDVTSTSAREKAIDDRLELLCSNMKAAGIVIYTVRVEVTTGSSTLLSNCATRPDMFYDVQSASNLSAVFSAIAGSIENLRITQ